MLMSTLAHNAVRTSLAAALLLLGMVSFSLASESPSFIRQSVRTSWTTDDGLPQNSVQAILQTSDGYLWLGTHIPFTWWVAIGTVVTFAVGYTASLVLEK